MENFNKRLTVKFFAIVLTLSMIWGPYAFADDVGVVSYVDGRVDILRMGGDTATPAREGDTLATGDALRTKSNAKAEVAFKDKSVLRLAQNTKIGVKDYNVDESGRRKAADIELERGKVRAVIAKMPSPADFIISTPNAKGTVKGSDIFAFYQSGNSGMLVAEGKLSVFNTAHPETVITAPTGTSVLIPLEDLPQGPRTYMELEKKLHEQDTSIPLTVSRQKDLAVTKGVIVKMSGSVKITPKGSSAGHDATLSEIIGEGDAIETGANGMIEIKFDNGNGINLKPGTRLLITRLVIDPKTGEYENLFESDRGKIRARIENLKGKSKFEVKTPTAVSGARGTMMYLEITPTVVRAFFEGGNGFLSNLISGLERTVAAGENSIANNSGAVSDPAYTSDADRESFGEGWEPGSGVEGYSAPEGTVGLYISTGDTGTVSIVNPETLGEEIPHPIFEPGATPPVAPVAEEETSSSGHLDGSISSYGSSGGTFESIVAVVTNYFWNGLSANFLSAGDFSNNSESSFIWYSEQEGIDGNERGSLYSGYNPTTETYSYTTYDGGAFYGFAGGIGGSGLLDGFSNLIYIDPQGNVGIAGGDLAGIYQEGIYLLGGVFTGIEMPQDRNIWVAPEDLYDSIYMRSGDGSIAGSFNGSEILDIAGTEKLLTISLVNYDTGAAQDWGIYGQVMYGQFSGANQAASWSAAVGGYDPFGAYYYRWGEGQGEGYFNDDYGYWLADIDGSWNSNGIITGTLDGTFITYTKMGDISGDILGTYNDGAWQAVGIGTWGTEESTPLTLSGYWGEEDASLYYNDEGDIEWAGEEYGLIGSATPNWWDAASFDILAIGEYYDEEESEPYIWNTFIYSYNEQQGNYTTQDGGAFGGFTAGIWNNGTMDGSLAAFYVSPTETEGIYNAGILRGDVSGEYYPNIEMWMATGSLTPTQMATGLEISSEDFTYLLKYIDEDHINNDGLRGTFGDNKGYIYGWQDYGYSYSIEGYDTWGIFDIKLGDENYYYNPGTENNTTWSAGMGGAEYDDGPSYWLTNISGTWEDNEIRGTVTGHILSYYTLGTIEGDLFGVYDEYYEEYYNEELGEWIYGPTGHGSWIATAIGSYSEEPLTLSGYWGEEEAASLYYNDEGDIELAGEEYGLIGSTTPEWWAQKSFPILAMGEYDDNDSEPYIWNTPIYSNDAIEDGGAFGGFTGGIWNNGTMDGSLASLYIDPDGNAGILRGDVSGAYYPDLYMWIAEGLLTPTQMAQDTGISPEDLWDDYVYEGYLDADFEGGFFANEEESYLDGYVDWGTTTFILDDDNEISYPWGIYDIKIAGSDSYYNPGGSTLWSIEIEGDGEFGYYDYDKEGSWVGGAIGIWVNGEVRGLLRGMYITDDYMAGIISGDVFGLYDETEDDHGTWIGESLGTFIEIGETEIYRYDIGKYIFSVDFYGAGTGTFGGGGSLETTTVMGMVAGIDDQPWGVWFAAAEGSYEGPTSPFRLALGGETDYGDYWLGTMSGDWELGRLSGAFKGLFMYESESGGDIAASALTGDVIGAYVEVGENSGTWQAAAAGEWVEVTDLLDPEGLGFDLTDLGDFVSVPITEVYSNILTGPGSFGGVGAISAAMDISLYATSPTALERIWAALINGTYSGPTGNDWAATVTNGSDTATLAGTQWSDNQWLANVSGAVGGNTIDGQAGGTYNDGTFSGVGAGTWQAPPE